MKSIGTGSDEQQRRPQEARAAGHMWPRARHARYEQKGGRPTQTPTAEEQATPAATQVTQKRPQVKASTRRRSSDPQRRFGTHNRQIGGVGGLDVGPRGGWRPTPRPARHYSRQQRLASARAPPAL